MIFPKQYGAHDRSLTPERICFAAYQLQASALQILRRSRRD